MLILLFIILCFCFVQQSIFYILFQRMMQLKLETFFQNVKGLCCTFCRILWGSIRENDKVVKALRAKQVELAKEWEYSNKTLIRLTLDTQKLYEIFYCNMTIAATPRGKNRVATHLGCSNKVNISPPIVPSHHANDFLLSLTTHFLPTDHNYREHRHLKSHYERLSTLPHVGVNVSVASPFSPTRFAPPHQTPHFL